jgi:hypothetical protein
MILRRICAALVALCMVASPSFAQKSKATLDAEVNTNWADNTTGAITPSLLRSTVIDTISSYVDWLSCTGSGGIVYWNAGTPTCLTAGSNGQILALSGGLPVWGNTATNLNGGTCITITGTITPIIGVTGNCIATAQLSNNAVTNAILAQMTSAGLKGNVLSNTTANVQDLTPGQVGSILCTPVRTLLLTGTSQTFTPSTCNSVNPTWLEVDLQGGGAGGSGSGTAATAPTASIGGSASVFGALTANGGGLAGSGGTSTAAVGGTCSGSLGTQQNYPGSDADGYTSIQASNQPGGPGANSFYGGAGASTFNASGNSAKTNSGSGGGGGGGNTTATVVNGGGGAAGCHIRTVIISPLAATYTYSVAGTAAGGNAGTSGFPGGNGGAGLLDIIQHWQ